MNDTRATVLLVGLGNIGFRHLQGLAPMAERLRLWGCDPAAAARERAAAEWVRLGGRDGGWQAGLDGLPAAFDTVIVATSAAGRLDLLRAVLPQLAGPALVLEKVVFAALPDFTAAHALLDAAGRRALVNCPRRIWPMYAAIGARLAGAPVSVTVRGSGLGLGSNGVHFLDLLQFLSGEATLALAGWSGVGVMPSKRDGYWEAHGRLDVATPGGSALHLSVTPDDPERVVVEITAPGLTLRVDEATGAVDGLAGWSAARPPYQSDLTGGVVTALLAGRHSGLVDLRESEAAHAVMLTVLGRHFAAAGIDTASGVPIT